MCEVFSCIVTKARTILTCENINIHQHEDIVNEYQLKDDNLVSRTWVRTRLCPANDDYTSDVDTWEMDVDEEFTLPEWFILNREIYKTLCKKAAKKWQEQCVDEFGYYITEYTNGDRFWWKNNEISRADGPAKEFHNGDEFWYKNNLYHRTDGPAMIFKDGRRYWFKNGLLHRLDGPACEHLIGYAAYWIEGKKLSEEEFFKLQKANI